MPNTLGKIYPFENFFEIDSKWDANLKWILENQVALEQFYNDEFVAIEDKKVLNHHSNIDELLNLLKGNKLYSNSTLIKFISKTHKFNKK